jgi:hypothetical protein
LEHEVGWESLDIALHRPVQRTRFDSIKFRQIGIEDYLFVAEVMDECGELIRHEQGSLCCV